MTEHERVVEAVEEVARFARLDPYHQSACEQAVVLLRRAEPVGEPVAFVSPSVFARLKEFGWTDARLMRGAAVNIRGGVPLYLAPPAAPQEPVGEPKWQPIETAPKDGTWVLVHRCGWEGPSVAQWDEDEEDWQDEVSHIRPTHWMPLPAAPQEQDGGHRFSGPDDECDFCGLTKYDSMMNPCTSTVSAAEEENDG